MQKKNNTDVTKFPYIDALRGWAIIGVIIFHTASDLATAAYPHWFKLIAPAGARGVQLFYLLSAITLCLSFASRSKKELHPIRNFYIRRFFRIAPLFYLAIIYYLWQNTPQNYSFANILTTFTFINGIHPLWINNIVPGGWSIAIEMTFYLLFPLLITQINNLKKALIITLISIFLFQLLRLYLLTLNNSDLWQEFTFLFFPSQFPVFLTGILTYYLITIKPNFQQNEKKPLLFAVTLILFSLIIQLIFDLQIIAGHYIFALFFALAIYFLSIRPLKLFVNPLTIFIGKISFSLYLTHFAVLFWLTSFSLFNPYSSNPLLNFSLRFILTFSLSSLLSFLTYSIIETRGQKLGKKLIIYLEDLNPKKIIQNKKPSSKFKILSPDS